MEDRANNSIDFNNKKLYPSDFVKDIRANSDTNISTKIMDGNSLGVALTD